MRSGRAGVKLLFFLAALANVVLFMWEYQHGAREPVIKTSEQPDREQILLVSESKAKRALIDAQAVKVDFKTLYPPGLDPWGHNLLTGPLVIEDFVGELFFSAEPQNNF